MLTQEQQHICGEILSTFGFKAQLKKCQEVCGELYREFHKEHISFDETASEIADVHIMCEQMAQHFGFEYEEPLLLGDHINTKEKCMFWLSCVEDGDWRLAEVDRCIMLVRLWVDRYLQQNNELIPLVKKQIAFKLARTKTRIATGYYNKKAEYTKVTHLLVEKALEVVEKAVPVYRDDLPEQAVYLVSTQLIAELNTYANFEAERLLGRFKKGETHE